MVAACGCLAWAAAVSTKRRNPKKNPAARRPRGRDMPGAPRARRFRLEDLADLLESATADQLPLMALPAVWLWRAGEDGHAAAYCVDCCVTVQHALAEYGIASEIQAVGVGIAGPGAEPEVLGGDDTLTPHYNEDGTFNGHTILVIPDAGRLVDPTIQQFDAIPRTVRAAQPMMAPLPAPGGLGTAPFVIDRADHFVLYAPLPPPYCDAWQSSPVLVQQADGYPGNGREPRRSRVRHHAARSVPRADSRVSVPAAADAPCRPGRHDDCR